MGPPKIWQDVLGQPSGEGLSWGDLLFNYVATVRLIYIKQASTLRSFATVALNLGDNYGICYITRYIVRCITRYVILPDMLYNRILGWPNFDFFQFFRDHMEIPQVLFVFASEKHLQTPFPPLCFPQVKPQVSKYPLFGFLKLFLRFNFVKRINFNNFEK